MLIRLYVGLFGLLLLAVDLGRASYVTHPNINFDSLEQLGISGSYSGISLYKDTQQLTQIEKSTSSVLSLSNDTFRLIASSNINGTIYAACILPTSNTLFVAGNFTTINGQIVNNAAAFDLSSSALKPMSKGLDGIVYSLYCDADDQSVYAGGSFIAPINSTVAYTDSLAKFGGSVAVWKNNQWNGLPWKGLNGPVYSILKSKTSILFGGKFDTTTDGQSFHAPASQPISIPSNGVTATNTASNSAPPASILCADASNANPWILNNGAQGTWTANFITYSVNPALIRIVNSKLPNHQTKEFSIRSVIDSTVYKLTYLDPVTNTVHTCSTNCTLSNDPSVTYQDYRITNISMTSGIAIDINSWYGVSGGLASVKVFQSEIFSYAVNSNNNNMCVPTPSKITTAGGSWTNATDYLTVAVKSSDLKAPPSATFYPNLEESGIYEVLVYTPTCTFSGCSDRTDIDVIINTSPNQKANVTMSQRVAGSTSVFIGYFDLSSNFNPSVTLQLAHNATITSGSTANMVAFAVQFVKTASVDSLSSILEYNTTQTNITLTSIPWGALNDNVPYQSVVKSMDLLNGNVYIGGNFTGTDKTNIKYTNIVQYDSTANQMKALQNGGVNGVVQSVACSDSEVFVGGTFTGLSGTALKVDYLSNVARYDTQKKTWSALNGGVDGPISALHWMKEKNAVLVSGEFSHLIKVGDQQFSSRASGNGWWNTQSNEWISNNVPYLSGVVYGTFSTSNNQYFIGYIKSAQTIQSSGISFISQANSLLPLSSFNPDGSEATISVSSGVLYHSGAINPTTQKNATTTILGGQFRLPGNIQNVAIYDNGTWSGVQGADWQGQVSTMAVNNDLLYVGGRFSGANSNNLAIFDLSNKSLSLVPEVKTQDGSPANVNVIRHIPTQNAMVIGGNFSAVGSLACSSICLFHVSSLQWSTVGSGLVGEVIDVQLINGKLVASGNLTLNNSPLSIAEYDFDKSTWGPFGTANLPGPSCIISYDNATNHLYISGRSKDSDTVYLRIWDGQQFLEPSQELGPGSDITGLTMLPIAANESTTSTKNILLASGFINLGIIGNVSAAFFDGEKWIPYLVASTADGGSIPSISSIFFPDQPFIPPFIKKYLPTPIVILVSIAISLAIVFLIVLGALVIVHFKRKRDSKVNPLANPASYYGKPPRAPQSLLTMLKEASPNENHSDKEDEGIEKSHHLEPENQHLYNMSKAISSDHLHEQPSLQYNAISATAMTTARAAPAPPTTHSRSVPQQNQNYSDATSYNNMSSGTITNQASNTGSAAGFTGVSGATGVTGANGTVNAVAAAGAVGYGAAASYYNSNTNVPAPMSSVAGFGATASYYGGEIAAPAPAAVSYAMRPDSYVRPVSEIQRDSNTNSFYSNEYTKAANTEMSEIPARYSPYNPFRNSEIGMAVGGVASIATATAVGAGVTKNKVNHNQSNNSRGISSEANARTFASQPQGQAVSYGNIAAATPSTLAPSNNRTPETVRWTNAAVDGPSIAIVEPVSLVGTNDTSSSQNPSNGLGNQPVEAGKTKWANVPSSEEALATAVISSAAPAIAIHRTDEDSKYAARNNNQQQEQSYLNPALSTSTSPFNASMAANTANNVRWTNYNTDASIGTATVEPVSIRDSTFDLYYPSSVPTTSINTSLLNAVQTSESLSSDPDIVRWTAAPSASTNISTATVAPVEPSEIYGIRPESGGRSQYQASLSSLAWPQDEDEHEDYYEAVVTGSTSNAAVSSAAAASSAVVSSAAISSAAVSSAVVSSAVVSSAVVSSAAVSSADAIGAHSGSRGETGATNVGYESFKNNNYLRVHDESVAFDDKMINTNAFRLSDAGSLPPIDTTTFSFNPNGSHEDTLSPDSAVRWKTTNVGSPIETVCAPLVLEPATATVTRRSANQDDADLAFQNYYNFNSAETTQPVEIKQPIETKQYVESKQQLEIKQPIETKQHVDTKQHVESKQPIEIKQSFEIKHPIENKHSIEVKQPVEAEKPVLKNNHSNHGNNNKYRPVVNTQVAIDQPIISSTEHGNVDTPTITTTLIDDYADEPVGKKSEAIEDIIASRDLAALSMLTEDENPLFSQPSQLASKFPPQKEQQKEQEQTHKSPTPTNTRSTPSPAAGAGALDGRAASKRMVEEYLNSRNKPSANDDSKQSKYKSDFKSIMEAAILNNTTSEVATEDKPHLYYAKFDFSAREHGELGFEKADAIIVIDSSDDIWWMGYKADRTDGSYIQGVFPSNYVEIAAEIR